MKHYFAPMEGINGYIYRNAYHKYFDRIDKYFTPFIAPNQNMRFSSKELNDVLPEHNQGMMVVPQILTNHADYFIWAALELQKLGYDEINLNLGCPARTVVTKHRGSGFLAHQEELNLFLDRIFSKLDMKISLKIRIGKDSPEEFYELIDIFNLYPLEELIIHPRLQTDYYKNTPNLSVFKDAQSLSKNPICYNGDLFTFHAYEEFTVAFPEVETVMLGRGLIANPGLIDEICYQRSLDKKVLKKFHDTVYEDYQEVFQGSRNTLFKMKELWFYMIHIFSDNSKYAKKIRKVEKLSDYEAVVSSLFMEQNLVKGRGFPGM